MARFSATVAVPLALATSSCVADEPSTAGLASTATPTPVAVSAVPKLTVVGADTTQRAALDEALDRFRTNHLELPDLEVRFSDDPTDCYGHNGGFQQGLVPWRVLVCSELDFVITHELAHAWAAANLDDNDRHRYIAARGLTNWNDHNAPWNERGTEDAAFIIQQNLTATNPPPTSPTWAERTEAYALLTGTPSPLRRSRPTGVNFQPRRIRSVVATLTARGDKRRTHRSRCPRSPVGLLRPRRWRPGGDISTHTRLTALALTAACVAITIDATTRNADRCTGPVVLNDNGAWPWFEDERAVIDTASGTLLLSSVADGAGSGGADRDGNVEVVAYDLASGTLRRTVLHRRLEADDHNSAALYIRPDGRYVAAYSRHATDTFTRWRVSDGSGSDTGWAAERVFDHGAPTTYSNLLATPDDGGTLYNFVRTNGRDPHFLVSDDNGSTWTLGGRLLDGPGRPYVRYATDVNGRVHLIATEQHPADFGNSIYHGIIDDSRLLTSNGQPVDHDLTDATAVSPTLLTKVFAGDEQHRAWTIDLQIDPNGQPHAAFSVQSPDGLRYHHARFDGSRWHVHPLAPAGRGLYSAEREYTGLVALDPHDPSRLVVSTDVDPTSGATLLSRRDGRRHYELFEGRTIDGGATWSWTPVTSDSTVDNLRPIIPSWDGAHSALLWLRGTYTTYQAFDLDVVGLVDADNDDDTVRHCRADEGAGARRGW